MSNSTRKRKKRSKKKRWSVKKKVIISTLIIFSLLICTLATGYMYIRNKIYSGLDPSESISDTNYKEVEGITNVLLIGTDARTLDEASRADSIIIATLDNNKKEIRLTSLFRDTLVNIPGHGEGKLNAALAYGGPELLIKTIKETYGIGLDKYVIVNFWGFEAIIDQMGGLELNVEDYMLEELNEYIGESTGGNDCPVTKAGIQVLNGKQALSYARIRKGVGDEYERTNRQREVLIKVTEKLKKTKPSKYLGIMNNMLEYIKTNIEPIQALNMAYTIYKFPSLEIKQLQIPIPDLAYGGLYKNLGWVFLMDREQNAKFLDEFIFEGKLPNPEEYDYDSFNEAMSNYKSDSDEYNNKHNINPEDYLEDGDDFVTPTPSTNKGNGSTSGGNSNGSNGGNNGNSNSGSTIQKPTQPPVDNEPENVPPEQSPVEKPEQKPDGEPEQVPGSKPEETPDLKPEETPAPDSKPEEKPINPPSNEPEVDTDVDAPVYDSEQDESQESIESVEIETEN